MKSIHTQVDIDDLAVVHLASHRPNLLELGLLALHALLQLLQFFALWNGLLLSPLLLLQVTQTLLLQRTRQRVRHFKSATEKHNVQQLCHTASSLILKPASTNPKLKDIKLGKILLVYALNEMLCCVKTVGSMGRMTSSLHPTENCSSLAPKIGNDRPRFPNDCRASCGPTFQTPQQRQ